MPLFGRRDCAHHCARTAIRVLPVRGSGIITAAARLVAADKSGVWRGTIDESGRGLDVAMAAESADAIVAIVEQGVDATTAA